MSNTGAYPESALLYNNNEPYRSPPHSPPLPPPPHDPYQQGQYVGQASPTASVYQPLALFSSPQQPYHHVYSPQPYQPQYVGYQTAYVTQPVYSGSTQYSKGTGIGWVLFVIGFFVPLCWLFGSFFLCTKNTMDKRSGSANLIAFICFISVISVILILSST